MQLVVKEELQVVLFVAKVRTEEQQDAIIGAAQSLVVMAHVLCLALMALAQSPVLMVLAMCPVIILLTLTPLVIMEQKLAPRKGLL